MRKYSSGFTLVELSIVLVIIGILIGGILAARSMIETAQSQKFIRSIQQYDTLLNNYSVRFKYLPGDTNRNGAIDTNDPTAAISNLYPLGGEIGLFWNQLSTIGLKNKNGDAYPELYDGTVIERGVNLPDSSFGKNTVIVVLGGFNSYSQAVNYYIAADWRAPDENFPNLLAYEPSFTPAEALAIDKKIDDGGQNTGYVSGSGINGGCGDGLNKYDVTNTSIACELQIWIGYTYF